MKKGDDIIQHARLLTDSYATVITAGRSRACDRRGWDGRCRVLRD